jgi:Holliday junction resolvase RusA-like endonuclease
MTEIMFTIPHRLTRLNEYIAQERSNKYAAAKIKSEQTTLCSYYVPNIQFDNSVEIIMIWTVKNLGNDLDNISFGAKFVCDAMVQKQMIRNDNLTVIKKITHKYLKGTEEKVTVIVREWEDENNISDTN